MLCRHCGRALEKAVRFCPQCGTPTTASAPPVPKKKLDLSKVIAMGIGAVLVLVILVFAVILAFSGILAREEAPATEPPPTLQPEESLPTEGDPIPNPVPEGNPYRDCYTPAEFVLPESSIRYYAPAELADLSDQALIVAKAEISARHGATPNDQDLFDYLSCLSWYTPGGETENYSTYEEQNLFLLDVCLRQRDGSIYRTANPYMLNFDNGYFLSHSGSRYLNGDDLHHLSERELVLARNEIFARQGYIFSDASLGEYFCCQSWYKPTTLAADFDSAVFSDQENANLQLIRLYEDIRKGIHPDPDNPYMPYYDPNSEHIFFNGNDRILNESDVCDLSIQELIIARNEIFARLGYSFTDEHLMQYFLQCSWYRPQVAPGRLDLIQLGGTASKNVDFLQKYQDTKEELADLEDGYTTIPN